MVIATLGSANGCRATDATAACPANRVAFNITLGEPTGQHATIIYNRHGDDSLSTLDVPRTGGPMRFGTKAGIYDYRIITAGYHDYFQVNVTVVAADACGPDGGESELWMQPVHTP